jgi:hypothetical protein
MPQATILFVQTDSPEAAFSVLRDAIANVVGTSALPRIAHAEPLLEHVATLQLEGTIEETDPPVQRVEKRKKSIAFKAPAGATGRERAIAYLRHLGRPEKRSAVARACGISAGASTAIFRHKAFQLTDAGLVTLADGSGDDEDGCTTAAPPHPPPAVETVRVEPVNTTLRPAAAPPPPVERRKPGPKPKPDPSSIDSIVTTSSALDYAVGAIRAELAIADRPLSLNKLLALTKFPRHVVAAALENKGFEPVDGGYVLAGPGGD